MNYHQPIPSCAPVLGLYLILYIYDRMMIMRNPNRLINDFKNQRKDTIWKHLDAMAANYAVYSTHLNGLSPFLTDCDVYLYCSETNVVIVCLDSCGHCGEQVYEESETLSPIIYEDGSEPRVSMVWKMAKAVSLVKRQLFLNNPDIAVYGVLLTEAEIINAYELYPMWGKHDFMVIDDLTRLKYKKIKVCSVENDYLDCKEYIRTILDASLDEAQEGSSTIFGSKPTYESNPVDDFEKMLNEFINSGMEPHPMATPMFPDQNEHETDYESEDDESEDDVSANDSSFDNNSPIEDELFPSGEIDQNNNISVKVEILRPIPNPREELDKLVGCTDIKRRMDELVALTSYNKMMHELFPENKQHAVSLHSIFLGRPGTGKTTVCKIFGSLLRQAGALSKGHVVVCDRGTFLGTLWGDEERSVRQVLEMAKGGVLMIDEAYLLNGKHDHDPGKLVIQLLMNILADESQRDIAVVLCGYKEPMMKMLDTNPGLLSRFPNMFESTDFTIDELLEITRFRVKDYDYKFTTQAWEKYSSMLAQAYKMRDPETWGNARFIANQLERIYIQHANRCIRHQPKDKQDLLMLTSEDILPIDFPRQKTRIGF